MNVDHLFPEKEFEVISRIGYNQVVEKSLSQLVGELFPDFLSVAYERYFQPHLRFMPERRTVIRRMDGNCYG